jgi:hypothetical protein
MDPMTIADLAEALRGTPRDAALMIDTPDGIKPLRMVRGAYGRGGEVLDSGASSPGQTYIVILSTHDL